VLTVLDGLNPAVWTRTTDAYRQFQDPSGRVRTEDQSIWVKGVK
jgi:hypothetical protein